MARGIERCRRRIEPTFARQHGAVGIGRKRRQIEPMDLPGRAYLEDAAGQCEGRVGAGVDPSQNLVTQIPGGELDRLAGDEGLA